jgi:hypothetical protein
LGAYCLHDLREALGSQREGQFLRTNEFNTNEAGITYFSEEPEGFEWPKDWVSVEHQ